MATITRPSSQKTYGITEPITLNFPTAKDIELTANLIGTLKESDFFESEKEAFKREIVLGRLNEIVKKFVKEKAIELGMSEAEASETGGKIYTFGSYRLGVHAKGADIDTLCVVPMHVTRQDFFGPFYEYLKAVDGVTELTQVPDAYVPIMKLNFDGISIDLLFCRLQLVSIPDNLNLLNNALLKNLDEKCTLSINGIELANISLGSRTTDEILNLVPNVATFHTALRCIKFWAQSILVFLYLGRALYSNVMGYVGGVACAILVARICQLYPNSSASRIISRFFAIYYSWKWPQPIMLKHIEDYHLNMSVWNPRINPSHRNHRMPIITPAYPSMCSTHNVSNSTLRVMKAEFERGMKICNDIENNAATWKDLFTPSDFFYRYRHFIQIVVSCTELDKFQVWSGFVESKIRLLVLKLEQVMTLVSAPPFPEGFQEIIYLKPDEHVFKYLQYPTPDQHIQPQNLMQVSFEKASLDKTFTISFYIALEIQPPSTQDVGPRKLNLSIPVAEFQRLCTGWDKYLPEMKLYIRELKKIYLPDCVFKGEPRPTSHKLPSKTPHESSSKDRQLEDDQAKLLDHQKNEDLTPSLKKTKLSN